MPVPTFDLTGSGATGIVVSPQHRRAIARLPETVSFGRKVPRVKPQAVKLSALWNEKAMTVQPPESINRRDKAAVSLARIYRNNVLGCCVISGKAHLLGLVSANDADSGGIILADDAEIDEQYRTICGPGDNGCYIGEVLEVFKTKGFKAGGKYYKIDGYVRVDNTDKLKTQVVQHIFGASTIGFMVPSGWMSSDTWDVSNGGGAFIGGHDVTPIDYGPEGVYVSSWGRIYLMTWPAWQSKRFIDEYYAICSQNWYNADQLSPMGFNAERLRAALAILGAGGIPDLEDEPVPPSPPPDEQIRISVRKRADGVKVLGLRYGDGQLSNYLYPNGSAVGTWNRKGFAPTAAKPKARKKKS